MLHKAVVREAEETTKVRIVYDASAKISLKDESLNECLETGSSLQNLILDILTQSRFRPMWRYGESLFANANSRMWEECITFSLGR